MTHTKQIHIIVRGRVQGVGFRMHTQQTALQIGCVGWVRNLPDGTVECIAQGSETQLQQLLDVLQVGPPAAQVQSVNVKNTDVTDVFDTFTIIR